ncbi:hypothetical protein ABZ901_23010 [Actinacidiphila alni]|uniref:hypothetical protein n=1 Tax=Actinacidiphila alni TaxID=380248 RepID=UPI0033F44A30
MTRPPQPRPPEPPQPPGVPPAARAYARTKATRLLSAGTYLHPVYRNTVIRELVHNRFRVVAPSYGYDAVTVLAHALAARRLRRMQLWLSGGAVVVGLLLINGGAVGGTFGLLLVCWLVWAAAYLRRVVTLHTLMTRLKETAEDGGFDGAHPAAGALTPALARKIDREQSASDSLVFYGGFRPFVGAGEPMNDWSNAQLLLGARQLRIIPKGGDGARSGDPQGQGPGLDTEQRKTVIPFTVDGITAYVAERMAAELREETRQDERIEGLTVERRRFTTAIRTNDRTRGTGWSQLPGMDDLPAVHWREDYDSAREYLCVRIGSWNEELVTSIFVGFDLKGNTLHTEFYPYVLGPLVEDFHLVDRLPDAFDARLALKVAWDMATAAPRSVLSLCLWPLRVLPKGALPSSLRTLVRPARRGSRAIRIEAEEKREDSSEFRLGRYVTKSVNCGALMSVREMATNDHYHHFFQKSDALKYKQIVERRLLEIIRTFLSEHNVDLADHDRAQNNILNYEDKSQNVSGSGHSNISYNNNPSADSGPARSQGD